MRFVTRAPRFLSLLIGGAMAVWVATLSPRLPILDVAGAAGLPQATPAQASTGRPLEVLFLGHDQPTHGAAGIYQAIGAPLARKGIQLTPVLSPAALTAERLANYDALLIYGNHASLTPDQEKALVDFVESGKGLVALHSASEMFAGSERYTMLIGALVSERQGSGSEFTAEIVQTSHPAVQGVQPFATWDETVTFTRQNATDRTVLMERADGTGRSPWTWVRTQGKGRVFYTAYGHDQRTWNNPGFQTLVERAIVWSVPEPARVAFQQFKIPAVTYVDGMSVPNYENRDPAPKYQLPFAVDEAMKFVQVPAEFTLDLFATEPDIVKPIAFAFDERGRMWIAETIDYPNEPLAGNPGDDRIRILEDTNGDGRADKFTVFADKLNIPTSLVFANGGVIVAQPPQILFLKDTNGDDKADERKVLSTGWGQRDTHAVLSNLQYGLDNYIWGVVGYSGFNGEINGKKFAVRAGRVPVQARRQRLRSHDRIDEQHLGAGLQRDVRRVRLDGQQRSELQHGDSQPLLRRDRGAADARPARRGIRLPEHRRVLRRAPADAVHPAGGRLQRLHGWRGSLSVHREVVPARILESDRVHQRADRPSDRSGHHREAGRRLRDARRLEPRGRRGRVVRAGSYTGGTGRRGVVRRLVQLHHPAQPDAAGVQQRRRQRLRVVAPRSSARPDLPHRVQERAAGAETVALGERHVGTARRARLRQHALAAARRSGCSSSADRRTSSRSCRRSSRTRPSMRSGSTAARCTRCGRSRDSGRSTRRRAVRTRRRSRR